VFFEWRRHVSRFAPEDGIVRNTRKTHQRRSGD
jgi:hypothetical protein